ncbi:hypothetical protein ACFCW6_11340 [Streptomyces sp. NPDC056333]|uniref:hypothetical protein n=1 Tax=Streptomyces sp. NPDC056333 TaxID=3345786 RepID=UPI0035DA2E0D
MSHRRKGRVSTCTVVAVVAVAAVAGGDVVFAAGGSHAVAGTTAVAGWSMVEVRVVGAGERIDIGRGNTI